MLPEITFLTSYPPRECGIATFSEDLMNALNKQFNHSFQLTVAALETEEQLDYPKEVQYLLNPTDPKSYHYFAESMNLNRVLELVIVQHEFGFYNAHETNFVQLLKAIKKPVIVVFHTVLPNPDAQFQEHVMDIICSCRGIIVMTEHAKQLLLTEYFAPEELVTVIPHGTHLVAYLNKETLKERHEFLGKKILTTFGLMNSGKNIEITLQALPSIIDKHPDVLFLVIGKTHPEIVKREGESYRQGLQELTHKLGLQDHVQFIDQYVALPDLLNYLQLTDVYLFTSKDPNQTVSGTLSYAFSCGCPIISTPIPHALEILEDQHNMIVPFSNSEKLSESVNYLLGDDELLAAIQLDALHKMAMTSWNNVAIQTALLFKKTMHRMMSLDYQLPEFNLQQIVEMTTDFGMIQFSKINQPDSESGYTLDDNAQALIAICQHYKITRDETDLKLIDTYLSFIEFCLQPQGYFFNYVNHKKAFTEQNFTGNLSDSNGRAIWALGYLISLKNILPETYFLRAEKVIKISIHHASSIHSTRAMSFVIKGMYYYYSSTPTVNCQSLVTALANRLVEMYVHESSEGWEWFESYVATTNSLLPEALLNAYEVTKNPIYRSIAKASFNFLLLHTFSDSGIMLISNKGRKQNGPIQKYTTEQPINVAYTVLMLGQFHEVFQEDSYLLKLQTTFNWFLGQNHLQRMLYNPCTGGCCDGLEENHVNLNQSAESTVSYLMARLTIETYKHELVQINQLSKQLLGGMYINNRKMWESEEKNRVGGYTK